MIHRHCQVCVKSGALGWLLTAAPAPSLRTMGESAIVTFQQVYTLVAIHCYIATTVQCNKDIAMFHWGSSHCYITTSVQRRCNISLGIGGGTSLYDGSNFCLCHFPELTSLRVLVLQLTLYMVKVMLMGQQPISACKCYIR